MADVFKFNPLSGQFDITSDATGTVTSVSGTADRITVTGTTDPIVDIASTYVGQTTITTLGTIATGIWHGTKIGLAYGGTNTDLSSTGGTGQVLKQETAGGDITVGTISASDVGSGAALTRVDDTNVTLTLGGTPTTALLKTTSLTLGWSGTLAAARLNSNVVQAVSNDTNVTGSIAAQNLTLGWSGQLGITRGGTGQATANAAFNALSPMTTLGDIIYGGASGAGTRLAGSVGTTRKFLMQQGTAGPPASAAPAWDTILAADIPGSELSKTDDTNVTLTLGGSPTAALLAATSLTLGWTGVLSPTRGGTGIVNSAPSTITMTGGFPVEFTLTASTGVTLPTSGTLYGTKANSITSAELLSSVTNETGTGVLVFNDTPTLVTPVLGVASGTSLALSGTLAVGGALQSARTVAVYNDHATTDQFVYIDNNAAPFATWYHGLGTGNSIDGLGWYNFTATALRMFLSAAGDLTLGPTAGSGGGGALYMGALTATTGAFTGAVTITNAAITANNSKAFLNTPTFSGSAQTGLNYGNSTVMTVSNTTTAGTFYAGSKTLAQTVARANTLYGDYYQQTASGISITTGTLTSYGAYYDVDATITGNGGNANAYAGYFKAAARNSAFNAGTFNTYGVYIANGTVGTNGTSTQYGLYIENITGADTKYAIYSASTVATCAFGASITPITNGVGSVGSGTLSWANNFISANGSINFGNYNMLVSHATGILSVTGGVFSINGNTTAYGRLGQTLEVNTVSNYGGAALNTWSATAAEGSIIDFNRSYGTSLGSWDAPVTDSALGALYFRGANGLSSYLLGAWIGAFADETYGTLNAGTRLQFSTTLSGGTVTSVRMTILNSGNVGIGTTSPAGVLDVRDATSGLVGFSTSADVFGEVYMSSGNTINGVYNTNGNGELWLNYDGYQASTTQFRDLQIGNGKRSAIMFVDGSAGNVGIQCATPARRLQVDSANASANGIRLGYGAATTEGFELLYLNSGNTTSYIDSMYDNAGSAMLFRMRTNGTPVVALTLAGTGAATFVSTVTSAGYIANAAGGIDALTIQNSGASKWQVGNTAGNAFYIYNSTGGGAFTMQAALATNDVTFSGGKVGVGGTAPINTFDNAGATSTLSAATAGSRRAWTGTQTTAGIATSTTADVFRFIDGAGTLIGLSGVAGTFYVYSVRSDTGANAVTNIYNYTNTGNGATNYSMTNMGGDVRGTSPMIALTIVADGAGGAAKLQATTPAQVGFTTRVTVFFVGYVDT